MLDKRIFGLDLMRSFALFIVVLIHSQFFLARNFKTTFIGQLPDGVELFFVLSGFLIGRFIIRDFVLNDNFNRYTLLNFFQRRWFRTLPNYYLFLLLNIILIAFGLIPGQINKYLITYPFFLQNFNKPYDFLFWESWSLSLEEWFYLLFPLLLYLILILRLKFSKKTLLLCVIILFLVGSLILRLTFYDEDLDRDLFFRKLVLMRLDASIYGVLIAFLLQFYPHLFRSKFVNRLLFVIGIVGFFYFNRLEDNDFFRKTIFFNLQGLVVMLWIPFLSSWNSTSKFSRWITQLSLISFVIYLTHLPLLHILDKIMPPVNDVQLFLVYLGYWLINIILGHLIFTFFERPIMLNRERISFILQKKK